MTPTQAAFLVLFLLAPCLPAKTSSHDGPKVRCATCTRGKTGKTSGACPGYGIDHKAPLKRGGADAPSDMQWQTTADAKAKDRVED